MAAALSELGRRWLPAFSRPRGSRLVVAALRLGVLAIQTARLEQLRWCGAVEASEAWVDGPDNGRGTATACSAAERL